MFIIGFIIGLLQVFLALAFLMAGVGKLLGLKMHVDGFRKWRLPQWFRMFTGLVETIASALLIVGFWNESFILYGAIMLVFVGIGGVLTHIRIKDSFKDMLPILVLGLLSLLLTIIVYF